MKKKILSGFDEYWEEVLRKNPAIATEYDRQVSELPVPTQLAIMRLRRGLTQSDVAKILRVKQPHVARAERADHDSKISSLEAQARAIQCRIMLVPEKYASMVRERIHYSEAELDKIERLAKARGGKSLKNGRAMKRMRGFLKGIDTAVKREKDRR